MRKSLVVGLSMLVTLLWASLAMAAEAGGASAPGLGTFFSYAVIAAGFGIGIAAFGTGIGAGLKPVPLKSGRRPIFIYPSSSRRF